MHIISETLVENVLKFLISKMPPDTAEKAGELVRAGVSLKEQLDRIEQRQAAIEMSLKIIVTALQINAIDVPRLVAIVEKENADLGRNPEAS